jgi:hypothetical protein
VNIKIIIPMIIKSKLNKLNHFTNPEVIINAPKAERMGQGL